MEKKAESVIETGRGGTRRGHNKGGMRGGERRTRRGEGVNVHPLL